MDYLNQFQKFAAHVHSTEKTALTIAGVNPAHVLEHIKSIPQRLMAGGMNAQRTVAHHADRALSQNVARASTEAAAQQAVAKAHPSMIFGTGMPTPAMADRVPSAARSAAYSAGADAARSRLGFGSGLALGAGTLGLGALAYGASQQPPPYNNTGGMSY